MAFSPSANISSCHEGKKHDVASLIAHSKTKKKKLTAPIPESVNVWSMSVTDPNPCVWSRVMYARFRGSDAPVAEQYNTLGS